MKNQLTKNQTSIVLNDDSLEKKLMDAKSTYKEKQGLFGNTTHHYHNTQLAEVANNYDANILELATMADTKNKALEVERILETKKLNIQRDIATTQSQVEVDVSRAKNMAVAQVAADASVTTKEMVMSISSNLNHIKALEGENAIDETLAAVAKSSLIHIAKSVAGEISNNTLNLKLRQGANDE
jgi:hypothetical protein